MTTARCLLPLLLALASVSAGAAELAKADYPEGLLWHRGRLYYGEMMRDRVMVSDLRTTSVFWRMPGCGPVSIAPYRSDELLVLCHLSHNLVRLSTSGAMLAIIDRDDHGRPFVHPNDSSADGKGGVFFTASGEFSLAAPATGAVLYLDREGGLQQRAGGIHYANGIAVDAVHRRLLVSEHLGRRVVAFPLQADGSLGRPSVFFDLAKLPAPSTGLDPLAGPDGLELDAEGRLFVAEYGAGRVHLVGADGALIGTLGGLLRYVTDLVLLSDGRAAITEARLNNVSPYAGDVVILDDIVAKFARP